MSIVVYHPNVTVTSTPSPSGSTKGGFGRSHATREVVLQKRKYLGLVFIPPCRWAPSNNRWMCVGRPPGAGTLHRRLAKGAGTGRIRGGCPVILPPPASAHVSSPGALRGSYLSNGAGPFRRTPGPRRRPRTRRCRRPGPGELNPGVSGGARQSVPPFCRTVEQQPSEILPFKQNRAIAFILDSEGRLKAFAIGSVFVISRRGRLMDVR